MRIFFFIKADTYSTEKTTKEKKLSSWQRTKTKEQKILFNYVAASALTEHKFMVELRSFRRGDVTFFPDEFSVSRNDVRQEILSVDLRIKKDPSLWSEMARKRDRLETSKLVSTAKRRRDYNNYIVV